MLVATSRRGDDLAGNLIVGDESFARWQALAGDARTHSDYPALADVALAGHPPASSAGGERPKFGVLVDGLYRLVKFATRGGPGDRAARRWCDLLVLEALALGIVSSRGIAVAQTTVVETPGQVLLESDRFDRVGVRGRLAVLSLAAVHEEPADSWARAAVVPRDARRLGREDAGRLQWLDAFGALIGNTDRHPRNVVFFAGGPRLSLAPAFDQAPMLYAPSPDDQLPARAFVMPHATADTLEVWDDGRMAAFEYWKRARDDARVSDGLRSFCAANATTFSPPAAR